MKEQPKVGIVDENHQPGALLRLGHQGIDNLYPLRWSGHVARGIIRKIQQDDQFFSVLRRTRKRLGETRRIEPAVCIEGVGLNPGPVPHFIPEPIVAPQLVGKQQSVIRIEK